MSAPCFDTLAFANRLKAAGVGQAHAEAEAEALGEVVDHPFGALATKEDLRAEIGKLSVRSDALDARVDKLESKLAALTRLGI